MKSKNLKALFPKHFPEIFIITLLSYLLFTLVGFITINLHMFDSIEQTITDFDINDLIYLDIKDTSEATTLTPSIVLVNIAKSRTEISKQIDIIESYKPKIIGVDAWFKGNSQVQSDSLLSFILHKYDNIVLAGYLQGENKHKDIHQDNLNFVKSTLNGIQDIPHGYANFVAERENTVRYFSPKEIINEDTVYSFTMEIIKRANYQAFNRILQRDYPIEYIYYTLNSKSFLRFDSIELYSHRHDLEQLKGNIVILGQLGNSLKIDSSTLLEDLNFTPLNKKLSGRSLPDTYGAYIHANILQMMLDNKMTNRIPLFIEVLLSFLICLLHMYLFVHIYLHRPMWFHVGTKFIQLLSSFLIVGCSLFLLGKLHLKLNTGIILLPILLSVECIYFYDAIVKYLARKRRGFNSLFLHAKH